MDSSKNIVYKLFLDTNYRFHISEEAKILTPLCIDFFTIIMDTIVGLRIHYCGDA